TEYEQRGTSRGKNQARGLRRQMSGRTSAAIVTWPNSTPKLKESKGTIAAPASLPMFSSRSTDAKPRPWIKPKPKVISQRYVRLPRNRFLLPTYTIEPAINGSTIAGETVKILKVARASEIEWATVKDVMILSTPRKLEPARSNAKRNARWS